MNYENIKSLLLTLLVLMSLVLTWSLWTYQPNHGVIEKSKFVQDVNIGIKKEPTSLILPERILFHKNNRHYGTVEETRLKNIMNDIRLWNFTDFLKVKTTAKGDYLDFLADQEGVELIFSTELPIETIKGIVKIEDNSLESFSFNRIMIPVRASQQEHSIAYFVSNKHKFVFEAKINNFSYQEFYREIFQIGPRFPQYFIYKIDNKSFYLPSHTVKAERLTYYSISLEGMDFKNALFTDPSIVKQDFQPSGEESFSDGSRALFIDNGGDHLRFINPSSDNVGRKNTSYELIQKSIDFVNDHSGWTDTYQFAEWDPITQTAVFRLYINGLPVYNDRGLSKLSLTWDGTKLFNIYERPMFKLQVTIESESSKVDLPSGQTLIELLNRTPSFDPSKLEDIKVGYELIKDRSNAKVTVKPIWCIKHKGIWKKVEFDDDLKEQGGSIIVLE